MNLVGWTSRGVPSKPYYFHCAAARTAVDFLGLHSILRGAWKFFSEAKWRVAKQRKPRNLGGRLANLSAAPVTRWPGQRGCLELLYSPLTPSSFTALKSVLSLACLLSRFLARRSCSLSQDFWKCVTRRRRYISLCF